MAFSSTLVPTVHILVADCVTPILGVSVCALDAHSPRPARTGCVHLHLAVGALPRVAQPPTLVSTRHQFQAPFRAPRDGCPAVDRGFDEALPACAV